MTHTERVEIARDINQRRWKRLAKFIAEGAPESVIARERGLAQAAKAHLASVVNAEDAPLIKTGQGSYEREYTPRRLS